MHVSGRTLVGTACAVAGAALMVICIATVHVVAKNVCRSRFEAVLRRALKVAAPSLLGTASIMIGGNAHAAATKRGFGITFQDPAGLAVQSVTGCLSRTASGLIRLIASEATAINMFSRLLQDRASSACQATARPFWNTARLKSRFATIRIGAIPMLVIMLVGIRSRAFQQAALADFATTEIYGLLSMTLPRIQALDTDGVRLQREVLRALEVAANVNFVAAL